MEPIEHDEVYEDVKALVEGLSLKLVEVYHTEIGNTRSMRVVIHKDSGEVNTDDLSEVYNLLYPRYELILGSRDLSLEVSSPGLQRNLKDTSEFSVFTGKDVRVYSRKNSSHIVGRIISSSDKSVILGSYVIEKSGETGESIEIYFDDIGKAKLEYKWGGINGPNK